jgi:predicted alpha-1,2-mannosidase
MALGRISVAAAALGLAAALAAPAPAAVDPVSLVDPFVGTAGNGHTFPGATVPFGMVQFGPVTSAAAPGGYRYGDTRLRGFAVTRLSGAGCTNFGDLPLMPVPGPPRSAATADAGFSHRDEQASPGLYRVRLDSGIAVTLTATARTGLAELSYPASSPEGTLLVEPSASANARSATIRVEGSHRIVGSATSAAFGGACGRPPGTYTLSFALVFEQPFRRVGVWTGTRLEPGRTASAGRRVGAFVGFDTRGGRSVRVKVGISYVGVAGALGNLAAEARSWDPARVQEEAAASWRRLLGRVRVSGGSLEQRRVFETALYHALLAPNVFSDASGRYRGLDGRVHDAGGHVQYANFSLWDTYRGEMQLLALLAPARASDMVRSLLADGEQAGRLPRWPVASAETNLMEGDPAAAAIADAYAFGARGFDTALALRQLLAGAGIPSPDDPRAKLERPRLAHYLAHGYVPGAASTTLEYALADFAVSRLADALGDPADAATLLARSASWAQTFDPESRYVEPRRADGSYPPGVGARTTAGFVEGDAAQYTFLVPQDMGGLLAALGGRAAARARLDAFFARLNAGPGSAHAWLGNEPSLLAPYAYLWLGAPWRSAAVVHRALTTLFAARPDGLPGNDDLGALSAWYVWSALGLYPAIPGVPGLAVVAPLFPHAVVTLPGGDVLRIDAGAGRYVRSLRLDGRPLAASWLPLGTILRGGRLAFALGARPGAWATGAGSLPPSFAPAPPQPTTTTAPP